MICFSLKVSIRHFLQKAFHSNTVLGCFDVSVQQRGLPLQLSNFTPEIFNGLLQLLDDIDMFLLQFHCFQQNLLLKIRDRWGEIINKKMPYK